MPHVPRILVAYDGSSYADAALSDLKRAGLGSKALVRVISICDTWLPTVENLSIASDVILGQAYAMSQIQIRGVIRQQRLVAEKCAERLRKDFPGWKITSGTSLNAPASGILDIAEKWKPSLIVLGSLGHGALGRLIFGSVSYKVLTHAACSVRVARPTSLQIASPQRILIAVDGSKDAEVMVKHVAARIWRKNAEFRLVMVMDYRLSLLTDYHFSSDPNAKGGFPERILAAAAQSLVESGLKITTVIREGDPTVEIVREAKRFKADTLFLGSRGLGAVRRFLLGSVSSYLAEHAPCTVEVDR